MRLPSCPTNIHTSSEDEDESNEDESKMNSVVSKRKIMCGSTLPLKCVGTESDKVETVSETGTACRRRSKEYVDDAKTIAEVIPYIIGSSTKSKLRNIVTFLQKKG
jgi:hypothetical protein